MYSTCLFCQGELCANEAIEHFPIGRRLAFDASKGRLWVVCRRCERWNLAPLVRAMEGELAVLEEAWKEAEEIAAISDDMFLPEDVSEHLAELKQR
jgi:hypothetical protein